MFTYSLMLFIYSFGEGGHCHRLAVRLSQQGFFPYCANLKQCYRKLEI